tara:strand:- start:779 stop:1189 length:411 start_codon:yes stop_codon:yes gene_type:complete
MDLSLKKYDYGALISLFAIYYYGEYWMSYDVATFVYGKYGLFMLVVAVILLFVYTNPLIGFLGIIVSYILIRKSEQKVGHNYVSEDQKWEPYKETNKIPNTLEQKVIKERVPNHYVPIMTPNNVTPTCDIGTATKI